MEKSFDSLQRDCVELFETLLETLQTRPSEAHCFNQTIIEERLKFQGLIKQLQNATHNHQKSIPDPHNSSQSTPINPKEVVLQKEIFTASLELHRIKGNLQKVYSDGMKLFARQNRDFFDFQLKEVTEMCGLQMFSEVGGDGKIMITINGSYLVLDIVLNVSEDVGYVEKIALVVALGNGTSNDFSPEPIERVLLNQLQSLDWNSFARDLKILAEIDQSITAGESKFNQWESSHKIIPQLLHGRDGMELDSLSSISILHHHGTRLGTTIRVSNGPAGAFELYIGQTCNSIDLGKGRITILQLEPALHVPSFVLNEIYAIASGVMVKKHSNATSMKSFNQSLKKKAVSSSVYIVNSLWLKSIESSLVPLINCIKLQFAYNWIITSSATEGNGHDEIRLGNGEPGKLTLDSQGQVNIINASGANISLQQWFETHVKK